MGALASTQQLPARNEAPRQLFAEKPVLVFWETTRACLLSCVHCRASAIRQALPGELNTEEGKHLIDQVAAFGKPGPTMIFTGGDPLLRPDLFELFSYANERGVRFAVSPAASTRLTRDAIKELKAAGATSISLSLDSATAKGHDSIRREEGTYARTVEALRNAVDLGLNPQVNTTVMQRNFGELPSIFHLIKGIGVKTWEVFFLIRVGRGTGLDDLSAEQSEMVCNLLYDASFLGMTIRTVEAPFVRRVAHQRSTLGDYIVDSTYSNLRAQLNAGESSTGRSTVNPRGVLDGDGTIFVGYEGSIYPGGFVPVPLGNIRDDELSCVYRENSVLKKIRARDMSGPCGSCDFRYACGGSRARAFAYHGDVMASDSACLNASRSA